MNVYNLSLDHKEVLLLLPVHLDHLLWGKSAIMSWIHSGSPVERPRWRGTEASCQQPASTCQLCEWAILEMDGPAPVKPSDNCSPRWHWLQPHEKHWAELPSQAAPEFLTQRNHELLSECYFQPLNLGVICYNVVDNTLIWSCLSHCIVLEKKLRVGQTEQFANGYRYISV